MKITMVFLLCLVASCSNYFTKPPTGNSTETDQVDMNQPVEMQDDMSAVQISLTDMATSCQPVYDMTRAVQPDLSRPADMTEVCPECDEVGCLVDISNCGDDQEKKESFRRCHAVDNDGPGIQHSHAGNSAVCHCP